MNNFFKYFPSSDKKEHWGINVLSVGNNKVLPNQIYPDPQHPAHHFFTWETGRVLQEYTLVYIVNGNGVLETDSVKERILDGTIFMIYPNEKHRYKPDEETGWEEYWICFNGNYIEGLINDCLFDRTKPIFHLGFNEKLLNLFNDVVDVAKEENNGYQSIMNTAIIHILGRLYAFKQQLFQNPDNLSTLVVKRAKLLFRSKILDVPTPKMISEELEVGYSWFRKVFKENTGISPGQYFIQLKIQHAKELLINNQLSIKEIAYTLKFDSPFYFSKIFKQKTSLTPLQFRNKFRSINNH